MFSWIIFDYFQFQGTKLIQQLSKTNQLIKKFQNEVKSIKPTPESIQKIQKLNELND
jgi:hypothetical protein